MDKFKNVLGELIPDATSVFWKKGRLATFSKWPFKPTDGTCTAEKMAIAGFSVVNGEEPDTVECFICHKQLDGWEATDDPWMEHAKHQVDCPFILLKKQDELDLTIDDFYNLLRVFLVKEATREKDQIIYNVKMENANMVQEIPKICKAELKKQKVEKHFCNGENDSRLCDSSSQF